ncbi:MAG: S8 family serine peptidase [Anaerolineae bacterium]
MDPRKLHGTLAMSMEETAEEEAMSVIVLLRRTLRADSDEADYVVGMAAGPAAYRYSLLPAVAVEATPEQIEQMTGNPAVDRIWPDLPVHTMLDVSVPVVRAPIVWDAGFTGQDVTIAVVDTGIDVQHPDFEGRIADTVDYTGQGADDNNGHGTHVASTAAGSGAASDGKYRGVASGATIIAAKVLRGDGTGRQSDVMAGIEWAVQRGAQVINLSLGGPPTPCDGTDALSELVDAAVDAGVVMCVAAGNSGPGQSTIGSPGCARKVITVGATVSDPSTEYDQVARFSSRGPTADGRRKPDLALPGVGIIAARAGGTSLGDVVDDHYTSLQGTSMATPHATGIAALLLSANPNLSPEQVKRRVVAGARSMRLDGNVQGAGRGDAYNAFLDQDGQPLPVPPVEEPGGCLASVMSLLRR